jgi:uncharacterized membrane protein YhaH (DUF805 family)
LDWNYLLWRFDGRIGRQTFWIAFLAVAAVEFFCRFVVMASGDERLSSIISLAFGYPECAILAKRGHDRDISTWVPVTFYAYSSVIDFLFVIGAAGTQDEPSPLVVALTIPWIVFALVLLIDFGCRKGTTGPNRFGPDPLGPRFISRHNGSGRD